MRVRIIELDISVIAIPELTNVISQFEYVFCHDILGNHGHMAKLDLFWYASVAYQACGVFWFVNVSSRYKPLLDSPDMPLK